MRIYPASRLSGKVTLPGDKSISHRAAMLLAMAHGTARIENFAASDDCASTLACLRALGVEILIENSCVSIKGVGKTGFQKPLGELDCGNSGTTMRLLAGILAGQGFESVLTGDGSLRSRPMKRIIEPLGSMGVKIHAVDGRAPIRIEGRSPLQAIDYKPSAASAQLKSCVLLAGLLAEGRTSVLEKTPTRDHTERMLRYLGVNIDSSANGDGTLLTVLGDSVLTAREIRIPGDISSAAFFIAAAACLEGSEIIMENTGLNPSRTAIIGVLRKFGANIEITNETEAGNEPVGDLRVRGGHLLTIGSSNVLDGPIIASLIDEIPILAIFGTQIKGGLEIRDAGELRIKESDRLSAVAENLKQMGARIEEYPDGLKIERSALKGAKIDSCGDHRIAMAFAIAGLMAEGETEIDGAECAAVSFPAFFDVLESVAIRE